MQRGISLPAPDVGILQERGVSFPLLCFPSGDTVLGWLADSLLGTESALMASTL